MFPLPVYRFKFFFNDTATTEIYTLSLHDSLPILQHALLEARQRAEPLEVGAPPQPPAQRRPRVAAEVVAVALVDGLEDRKSTRLNSSHANISYAVFCLKKKKRCRTCIARAEGSEC